MVLLEIKVVYIVMRGGGRYSGLVPEGSLRPNVIFLAYIVLFAQLSRTLHRASNAELA